MNRSTSCHLCCSGGGVIAALALTVWLGLPIALSALSRIWLGFASVDPILVPLIVVALGVVMFGLWLGVKSHGRAESFMIGLVGSTATVIGLLAYTPVAVFGFLIVTGAIGANQLFLRRKAIRGAQL